MSYKEHLEERSIRIREAPPKEKPTNPENARKPPGAYPPKNKPSPEKR